jgi:hypothetical protein
MRTFRVGVIKKGTATGCPQYQRLINPNDQNSCHSTSEPAAFFKGFGAGVATGLAAAGLAAAAARTGFGAAAAGVRATGC